MSFCKIVLSNSSQTFSYPGLNSLSYAIPQDLEGKLAIGSLVLVPYRNQKENGVVIDIYDELADEEKSFKIREIEDLISEDFNFNPELIDLIRFVSQYYTCSYSEVLDSVLSSGLINKPEKTVSLSLSDNMDNKDNIIIQALLKARNHQAKWTRLKALTRLTETELKKELRKLQTKDLVEVKYSSKSKNTKKKTNDPLERLKTLEPSSIPVLTEEQTQVIDYIRKTVAEENEAQKFLVHGVTGSGKTEIYLRLIEDCFKRNQSSIFLVPEIALAPQLTERITQRFGAENVLIWHSALSQSEREFTFQEIIEGEPKVVVGARSAIFAPVKNLGLVIIDEEHENSYKQDSPAPRYHAKLVAEKRCELNNCPLILGSATPNIETYYKALNKLDNYHLLKLKKRVFDNALPKVTIIDMREEFNNANKSIFSRLLRSNIEEALSRKEQIILFLNKRGAASHVFCRNCGFVYKCSHCDSKTVYHSDRKLMVCHHCGFTEAHPNQCPDCNSQAIKFFGLGTQKLEEEVKQAFPEARTRRLDSDVSKIQNNYINTWNDFREGNIDILIGTQMIAKGLDNPNLTLVGVISADSNFSQLDYLADERGFQLLTQVSGRAGRKDKPGLVVFQSYQPEREVLIDAQEQDYEKFYAKEIEMRKILKYPPFSKLIRFLVTAENENASINAANDLHKLTCDILETQGLSIENLDTSQESNSISILGPCPALISKINNKYRYHLVIKIPLMKNNKDTQLIEELKSMFLARKKVNDVTVTIDIDSISLY